MENKDKIKIIQYHNHLVDLDCPCILRANGDLEISDSSRMPNDEELELWKIEMDGHISSMQYKEGRTRDFKPLPDQLDMIYWDKINGTSHWEDHVTEVKKDNPKPG